MIIASVFGVYLLLLIGLALWSRRATHSVEGYFLAGRKLPFWVVAFSTNATGESGWLLLGLTGMGYAVGAQAFWVVIGEVIGIALAWQLISIRLKRVSDATGAITVPDVFAAQFNDQLHVLRSIAVVIILVMVGAYVTAQMAAAGKALLGFVDLDYRIAVVVSGVVIIAYTMVGGYKAVSYSDVLQGVLMLLGLILVPLVGIYTLGGWSEMTSALNQQDPALLSLSSMLGDGLPGWILLVSFLAIGLPFLGVPQLMTRFMAARDETELKKAKYMSVLVILLFDTGAVLAGMAGRALFPELPDPELVLPVMARELFHPVIAGILMVVVLSAIMSTVDSLLLLASSAVVRDIMQQMLNSLERNGKQLSDVSLSKIGKVVTVIIGILAIVFALEEVELLFWFILFAWSGLGAAFGPPMLCMLFYRRTTLAGAAAGMVVGFGTTVFWVLQMKEQTHNLFECIPGFILGLLATVLVSQLTSANSNHVMPDKPVDP